MSDIDLVEVGKDATRGIRSKAEAWADGYRHGVQASTSGSQARPRSVAETAEVNVDGYLQTLEEGETDPSYLIVNAEPDELREMLKVMADRLLADTDDRGEGGDDSPDSRVSLAEDLQESFFRATALLNDTFDYAAADGHEFTCDTGLGQALHLWAEYGHDGVVAAAAAVQGREPLEPHRTSNYLEALAEAHTIIDPDDEFYETDLWREKEEAREENE